MDPNIEHMLDTGGRALSAADRKFVTLLFGELEQFQYQAPKDRALMFHPLRGYERYLIHKVTEIFPKLTSFSIGDEQTRRTVVCFKSKRKEQQMQFGQPSPERRPASRGSAKEPKAARPLLDRKSKTLGPSPSRGRPRSSDSNNRPKSNKYNTWGDDASRKRERGLNLEGQVINGDLEHSRSDAEGVRRHARNPVEAKKKYRSRRSRSQPQLHDRNRGKQNQKSYNDDSTDHHPSDIDTVDRKSRSRPSSGVNTPERRHESRRNKVKPTNVYEEPRRNADESHVSSGTDLSSKDFSYRNSDNEADDNEFPPSYATTSKAKNKAKRNMKRIQRTNSTRSCPDLNKKNNQPEYVNSDAAVQREREIARQREESPVFPRPTKHNLDDIDGRPRNEHSRKDNDRFTAEGVPVEEIPVPFNNRRMTSSDENPQPSPVESSTLDSFSTEAPVIVHKDPSFLNGPLKIEKQPTAPSIEDIKSASGDFNIDEISMRSDERTPPFAPIVIAKPEIIKHDKKTQTDLSGPVVPAAMLATHLASSAQTDQQNGPTPPNMKPEPPLSLNMPSGSSSPNTGSPASPYEKLGEYMYKAMLNFQTMLIGGQAPPPAHDFRSSNGPTPFTPPTTLFTPPTVQPLYVPWMAPQYFPDANRPSMSHQPSLPYSSQQNCVEPFCHRIHQPPEQLNKMQPFSQPNLRKENHIGALPRDDHWKSSHGYRYPENMESVTSSIDRPPSFPSRSSKPADEFDSDVSSEITNPELTVKEDGNGVMVYVRNSNRSSSASASVGDASSILGINGDSNLRGSPFDDDTNSYKKLPPSLNDKKTKKSTDKDSKSASRRSSTTSKKSGNSKSKEKTLLKHDEKRKNKDTTAASIKDPRITNEEVILSLTSAPLASLEDDDEIDGSVTGSYTSSHSCLSGQQDRMSHTSDPAVDLTNSLVANDLSPLVRYDDALEISCQDGSGEE